MSTKQTIVGVIHLPPSPGYPDAPNPSVALENAQKDLRAFCQGGVDAIILENNYDVPHAEKVGTSTTDVMTNVASFLRSQANLPVGICVLWNDYRSALLIAKDVGLNFIRVPVFVDTVRTEYGIIHGNAEDVIAARARIGAEHVKIFADVHVKHAELLSNGDLFSCVRSAVQRGADGVIITGKWTGHPPSLEDLSQAKKAAGEIPVFIGSGADAGNISSLLGSCDGAIVSTSLKTEGRVGEHRQNIVGWDRRIDLQKVADFVKAAKKKWLPDVAPSRTDDSVSDH